ncbi:helix-turn-helix transcriptional regulator [Halomonas sp. 3H]|uniref:helix-turn-helix transcriptional regulator n=1 Tax=Halomonas sp. 3H TaxID=2952527 RepID=UPI0020B8DD90|nr:helix-turn-helix transcriptional regulator [Halomonas sp. 3H]
MFNEMMRAEIWLQESLESDRTLEDLADRLGYSSSQIRRRFRQCFGMSPSAYRESLRLEKAARLLAYTPLGIRAVAEQCGYRNHSAFSRAFQRRFRQTPRDYRQSHRPGRRRRRGTTPPDLAVRVERLPRRTALVTRRYEPHEAMAAPETWPAQLDGDEGLPNPIGDDTTAIALLHDASRVSRVPRLDIGVLVEPCQADAMAMPPSLRLVTLPVERCACVGMEDVDALDTTLETVLGEVLPSLGEHYSGEALRLLHRPEGLELQLPLLPPPDAPDA